MRASRYFWNCNACGAQNSREDGECQFCECSETAECPRDNCSGPCVPIRDERLAQAEGGAK